MQERLTFFTEFSKKKHTHTNAQKLDSIFILIKNYTKTTDETQTCVASTHRNSSETLLMSGHFTAGAAVTLVEDSSEGEKTQTLHLQLPFLRLNLSMFFSILAFVHNNRKLISVSNK